MDILRFINSRDVREHLKNIGYEFTPIEAAWLVWQCKSITVKEKHAAWQEIIDTMPDRYVNETWVSLHDMIRKYIALENKYLENFYANDSNAVYMYSVHEKEVLDTYDFQYSKLYRSFNNAFDDFQKEGPCFSVCFKKKWIEKLDVLCITMRADGEIAAISPPYAAIMRQKNSEEYNMLLNSFPGMYFRFPLPFKKGDIVCRYEDNKQYNYRAYEERPIVFLKSHLDYEAKWGMTAYGYYYVDNRIEEGETVAAITCMDLEYYRGDFEGKHRVLLPLKKFCMGEISKEELDNIHRKIIMEEIFKEE